jgi:hypothetical protein
VTFEATPRGVKVTSLRALSKMRSRQGAITFHSEEHLATSDKGVALLRRFLEQQLKTLAEGRDPAGVAFTESDALVRFEAGNFLLPVAASKLPG